VNRSRKRHKSHKNASAGITPAITRHSHIVKPSDGGPLIQLIAA
jgi:hypothetical protein